MTIQPLTQDWANPSTPHDQIRRSEWLALRLVLLVVDAVVISLAFGLAYLIRFNTDLPLFYTPQENPVQFYTSLVAWLIPVWLFVFSLYRLYDPHTLLGGMDEYIRAGQATTMGMTVLIVFSFLDPLFVIARGWLMLTWMLSTMGVITARFAVRRVVYATRSRGHFVTPILLIGANEEGRAIAEHFHEAPIAGMRAVGFLDDRADVGREVVPGVRVVGMIDDAAECIKRYGVKDILIVASALSRAELLDVYQAFGLRQDVTLNLSSGLFELLATGMRVQSVGSVSLFTPNRVRLSIPERMLKKVMDVVLATLALIMLSPIMIGIALAIKVGSPGPVIYRRRVLGTGGKPFDAFKFRTMIIDGDEVLARHPELLEAFKRDMKLKDDPRVTRIGRILRKLSLDELPQLFNVLLGQMSLVGPRMITPEEADRYGRGKWNLLTVKPGITGLWQVSGRSEISYPERVQIDMSYIRNYSFWLDLALLARTLPAVLKKTGAY